MWIPALGFSGTVLLGIGLVGCSRTFERSDAATSLSAAAAASSEWKLVPTKDWDSARQGSTRSGGQPQIELLLQHSLAFDRPADRCEVEICTRLLHLIDSAERTIDFAIYGARNQTAILEALLRAQRRGVRVRGLVDRDLAGRNYYSSTDEWAAKIGSVSSDQLRESSPESEGDLNPSCRRPDGLRGPLQCLAYDLGTQWLVAEHASHEDFTDPEAGGVNRIMHHKFFVIDGRHVWTGSANLSDSGTGGYNANAVVIADSPSLAQIYTDEFEQLLGRRSPTDKKQSDGINVFQIGRADVAVLFSPQDDAMRFGIQALIAKARRSIDVAVFYLTNKYVVSELIAAQLRGVRVRVIVDATAAKNGYSKHELLRVAGIPTKVEDWGAKMHMKAAAIDGQFLVVGSMNWTQAGEDANDENTLFIHSPDLTSSFEDFFQRLWTSIPGRWMLAGQRPDPESQSSGSACADGVDNDFDGLADADDPGCAAQPPPLASLPPHRVIPKLGNVVPPSSHRLYNSTACDPSYPDWFVCLPIVSLGRDLDCSQVPYRSITVRPPDKHRLDSDGNGRGCEASRGGP